MPFVKLYTHAFKGPGGWYIENSRTTIGGKDPVSAYNSELWNSGTDANKEIARSQKRKLSYYANIYVVKDPTNPENEGGVFLFKFGKKIYDKILAAMQPEFEDEEAIDPFDFWRGANFKLKIKKVAGYWNYDSSEFAAVSPLLDDDDAMEAIWKKEYGLAEIIAADKFKEYAVLEKRMKTVLGLEGAVRRPDPEVADEDDSRGEFSLEDYSEGLHKKVETPKVETPTISEPSSDDDLDDIMAKFQKLAEA